jgi:hypothetical protein
MWNREEVSATPISLGTPAQITFYEAVQVLKPQCIDNEN